MRNKTIKCYVCDCGEDVYEDDGCCFGCGQTVDIKRFQVKEVANITKEK